MFVSRSACVTGVEVPPLLPPADVVEGASEFVVPVIFCVATAAALRFRDGTLVFGFAEKVDVPGIEPSLFRAFQPLLAVGVRFAG
jgi:hypothetical protein